MEEEQERVLQYHTAEIVRGVHMEEKLLSAFLQSGVFTSTMIETIRARPTPSEKLHEVLLLLPTRGPTAFDRFIEIIQEDYEWLANKLLQAYVDEQEKSAVHRKEKKARAEAALQQLQLLRSVPVSPEGTVHTDESFRTTPTNPTLLDTNTSLVDFQHHYNQLYMKIKMKNSVCFYRRGNTDISIRTPEPATFSMVESQLDELLQRVDEMEEILEKVNRILGTRSLNLDPSSHIVNLQISKKELEKQIQAREIQKNKYCDKINKMENACRDQSCKIEQLEKDIKRSSAVYKKLYMKEKENKDLIEKLESKLHDLDLTNKGLVENNSSYQTDITSMKEEIERLKDENEMLKKQAKDKKLSNNKDQGQGHAKSYGYRYCGMSRSQGRRFMYNDQDQPEGGLKLAVSNSFNNNNLSAKENQQESSSPQTGRRMEARERSRSPPKFFPVRSGTALLQVQGGISFSTRRQSLR